MADIVTSRIFVDGEKGITAAKLNDITASSVIQPAFYTNKPTASTVNPTDIALILQSGAYAQAQVSTLGGAATQAQIWSTRLRSFNAVGNCSFEVDQRNVGTAVGWATAGAGVDRWLTFKAGTMGGTAQQMAANPLILVPGTNFAISNNFLRMTLTTAQASLGTTDVVHISGRPEGPVLRELISDVHSISLLVRSSVAGLKFSVSLRDLATTRSLVKLCTIPTANTWTLIQLPNLPVWDSGATWALTPGVQGYFINIQLAAGANTIAPAADTWQNGNFLGAPGMSNFAASPVNSTFDIAFIQHEPGSVCSTLMDKPFTQNLDECLRYFYKSYDYDAAIGTANALGLLDMPQQTTAALEGNGPRYAKPMAKNPTITIYNAITGAANSIRFSNGSDFAVTGATSIGKTGFAAITTATLPAVSAGATGRFHYTADTGW